MKPLLTLRETTEYRNAKREQKCKERIYIYNIYIYIYILYIYKYKYIYIYIYIYIRKNSEYVLANLIK